MDKFKMIDLIEAGEVEIVTNHDGKVWVNIDGVCALRVGRSNVVVVETQPEEALVVGGTYKQKGKK